MEVTKFETYFQSRVTVGQMNKKLDSLKDPAIRMVNSFLGIGKGLPIPKQIESELSRTRLFTYDHFLMVESDPSIEKRVTEKLHMITDTLQKELEAFLQR